MKFPIKLIALLSLFLSTGKLPAQYANPQLLSEIREKLPEAFKHDEVCNLLMEEIKNVKDPEPVLKGYIGGVYIARSKHAPLLDKRSALKTGTTMLEEAIKEKPGNIELLFLRLSIQLNLPGFLGYDDNIETDKPFVLNNYKSAPPVLKTRIINFVKTSGFFSEAEQRKVSE